MEMTEPIVLARDCRAVVIPDGTGVTLEKGTRVNLQQSLGGTYTVSTELGFLARIAGEDADALGFEPERPPAVEGPQDASSIEEAVWEVLRTCFDPEIPVNIADLGLVYEVRVVPVGEDEPEGEAPAETTGPSGPEASRADAPEGGTAAGAAPGPESVPDGEAAAPAPPGGEEVSGGAGTCGHRVEIRMTLTAPGCGMGPVLQQDVESKVRALPGVEKTYVEIVFDPPWSFEMMSEAARLQLGMM